MPLLFYSSVAAQMGTFLDSGQFLGSSDSIGIALGDLDGDGDQDLDAFVVNTSGYANKVYLNHGPVIPAIDVNGLLILFAGLSLAILKPGYIGSD